MSVYNLCKWTCNQFRLKCMSEGQEACVWLRLHVCTPMCSQLVPRAQRGQARSQRAQKKRERDSSPPYLCPSLSHSLSLSLSLSLYSPIRLVINMSFYRSAPVRMEVADSLQYRRHPVPQPENVSESVSLSPSKAGRKALKHQ